MACKRLEDLCHLGELLVTKITGGERTNKQAPFDVVDFSTGVAYEVKTVSATSILGTNKIHIEGPAWERKQRFMAEYKLRGILMVVIIHDENNVEVYKCNLKQHLRISTAIKTGTKIN